MYNGACIWLLTLLSISQGHVPRRKVVTGRSKRNYAETRNKLLRFNALYGAKIADYDRIIERNELLDIMHDLSAYESESEEELDDEYFYDKPPSFGDNTFGIGALNENHKKTGGINKKKLTQVLTYSHMMLSSAPTLPNTDSKSSKKKQKFFVGKIGKINEQWDGSEPSQSATDKPTKDDWDKAAQKVGEFWGYYHWKKYEFKHKNIGDAPSMTDQIMHKAKNPRKPKEVHGVGGATLSAAKLYTDEGDTSTIVRRLFKRHDQTKSKMSGNIYNVFKEFAAKLYQGTHGSTLENVVSFTHEWQTEYGDRKDKYSIIVWHGMGKDAFNRDNKGLQMGPANFVWNPNNKRYWYGPTSCTVDIDVAKKFSGDPKDGGAIFEISIPIDMKLWPQDSDFGMMAALMFSKHPESEILLWNIPLEWMKPIIFAGKWIVRKYEPFLDPEYDDPGLDIAPGGAYSQRYDSIDDVPSIGTAEAIQKAAGKLTQDPPQQNQNAPPLQQNRDVQEEEATM